MTETSFARRVCGTSGCGALVALLLSPGFRCERRSREASPTARADRFPARA
jgi:hypothetical protein